MPRLRLTDAAGQTYMLHAFDPALIGPWLASTLPRLVSGISAPPIQLEITPLPKVPDGHYEPDWPPGTQEYTLDRAGVLELLDTIRGLLGVSDGQP